MISRLGSVPVFVSDVERALAFFRDALGFELRARAPHSAPAPWATVAPPGAETEVALLQPSPTLGQPEELRQRVGVWTGIVFLTRDIHQTFDELQARGVPFEGEPALSGWGGWEVVFRDPDGNRFHLVQRLDGRPR